MCEAKTRSMISHLGARRREASSKSGGFPVLENQKTAVDLSWNLRVETIIV